MCFRWERLEQLLTEATGSSDYDVTLAIDQLLDYILSDQGTQPHSFAKQRTFSTFSRALVGFIVLLPAHLPSTFSVPPPVSPCRRGVPPHLRVGAGELDRPAGGRHDQLRGEELEDHRLQCYRGRRRGAHARYAGHTIFKRRWLVVRSVLIGGGLCAVVRACRRAAGGRRGDDAHHELGTTPRPHAGAEQGVRPLTHIHVFKLFKPSYSRHDFP